MKKLFLFFLSLTFIMTSWTCSGITREELRDFLEYADTSESAREAREIAIANPQLLEGIIFLSEAKGTGRYRVARLNALSCLQLSAAAGFIERKKFFAIGCRFLRELHEFTAPKFRDIERSFCETSIANFGYDRVKPNNSFFGSHELLKIFSYELLPELEKNGLLTNSNVTQKIKNSIKTAKESLEINSGQGKTTSIAHLERAFSDAKICAATNASPSAYIIIGQICKNVISLIRNDL